MKGRRARGRRARPSARDQHESAFARILRALVARVPGALAGALVDQLGETVDYAGRSDPFDIRLAAAHWRLVLGEVLDQPHLAATAFLLVRTRRRAYLVHSLPDGYALLLSLGARAGFSGWQRAMGACVRELALEAGWAPPPGRTAWHAVDVQVDAGRRPSAIGAGASRQPVEVLGAVASGVGRRERGWRVRLDSGLEVTLVREPGGTWYADDADGPNAR